MYFKTNGGHRSILTAKYNIPPGRSGNYHFEHLYTVDWNGLKKVKTGRFMALHRKTKHYSVFANHEHWERLIDAYPISYYFP